MLDTRYFKSLTLELNALRDRVRSFIQDSHWPTDGEWKESVLRSFLRRNLPESVQVGRGFVITETATSHQIDVLIYDSTKPVLFRDGDFVLITPDAVLGIIEVKTSLNGTTFKESIKKLCDNAELIQVNYPGNRVYGLFSFKDQTRRIETTLGSVKASVRTSGSRIVHCICLGDSKFIRYWNIDPEENRLLDKWYAYELKRMAPGYFIHNIIERICPQSVAQNQALWYPQGGKERHKIGEISLR